MTMISRSNATDSFINQIYYNQALGMYYYQDEEGEPQFIVNQHTVRDWRAELETLSSNQLVARLVREMIDHNCSLQKLHAHLSNNLTTEEEV